MLYKTKLAPAKLDYVQYHYVVPDLQSTEPPSFFVSIGIKIFSLDTKILNACHCMLKTRTYSAPIESSRALELYVQLSPLQNATIDNRYGIYIYKYDVPGIALELYID